MIRVQGLTPSERIAVQWALDGQKSAKDAFDSTEEMEEEGFDFTIPYFDDDGLVIEDKDAVDDLLYRLEVQLDEMANSESSKTAEGRKAKAGARAGGSAGKKIRAEIQMEASP